MAPATDEMSVMTNERSHNNLSEQTMFNCWRLKFKLEAKRANKCLVSFTQILLTFREIIETYKVWVVRKKAFRQRRVFQSVEKLQAICRKPLALLSVNYSTILASRIQQGAYD